MSLIAFDNAVGGASYYRGVGTTLSFSFTTSGSERVLLIGLFIATGVTPTSVTYGGANATFICRSAGNQQVAVYGVAAPLSGANTVSVITPSSSFCGASVISLTGAAQATPWEANNTNAATNTTPLSTSATSLTDNAWFVLFVRTDGDGISNASTNSTSRVSASGYMQVYTYGPKTPAGALSMTETHVVSQNVTHGMVCIKPAGSLNEMNLNRYPMRGTDRGIMRRHFFPSKTIKGLPLHLPNVPTNMRAQRSGILVPA